ncbi:DUF7507 domain-containing protein, partial [Pseudodonghicola xiamenensis]|uniref:DUF7507 domain-containing protein n=1 Tax=Pseudodonghicola xiamenensis TaxID=337702 RepID=UPI001E626B50
MAEELNTVLQSDAELTGTGDFTVITDQADYSPGDTATITASGVATGGSVTFEVDHVSDPGPDGIYGTADDTTVDLGGDGHESWTVVDGGEGDLDGIANGVIVTEWYVNPDDSLNETFLLSASTNDGQTSYTSFTDGASYNLDQYKNGPDISHLDNDGDSWVNGNLNENQAHYYQGDFVPYRATLSDLSHGTYFLTIEYDVTQSGEFSLDYLGSYDASYVTGATHEGDLYPDPKGDGSSPDSELAVALSPIVDAGLDQTEGTADDIAQVAGNISMFDASLLGFALAGADGDFGTADDVYYLAGNGSWGDGDEAMVTGYATFISGAYALTDTITSEEVGDAVYHFSGSLGGNSQQSVTVMFDYSGPEGADAVIAWGGHIATNQDWADSANPTGSPYHMRLLDMEAYKDNGDSIQVTGTGNQDRSLSRSAIVVFNPSIEVIKTNGGVEDLDGNGDDAGDQIVYNYSVTNTGDVVLLDVTATDDLLGAISLSGLTDEDGDGLADDLAVGATATGTATELLDQDQVDDGSVTNVVTAEGTDPAG